MLFKLKKYFILLIFLSTVNCAGPGVALLSPVITGAKTKSAHQASLSLVSSMSSKKVLQEHGEKIKNHIMTKSKEIFEYLNHFHLQT